MDDLCWRCGRPEDGHCEPGHDFQPHPERDDEGPGEPPLQSQLNTTTEAIPMDDDPPNIEQDLVDQFLAALYYGGSWTFDQAASRESIFRRRLREALGVADAAIAAAHEVIGQCDCIMAEGPQDDPKRVWREARDAYRGDPPPED
jgi:hypothetical protein